jgi:predicted lipoprotein with Yx(FWY)xxD motif
MVDSPLAPVPARVPTPPRLVPRLVKRLVPLLAALAAALLTTLVTAACSSGGSSSSSSTPAATSTPTGSAAALVITTKSGSAGSFLTNGSGRAVYMWAKDGMDKSECSGACASAWPPVLASGTVTAAGGAVAKDLGSITRSDGSKQVTYDGHPLYYFAGDTGPGTTNGQGSNGFGAKWWLVAPSGAIFTAVPGTSPSSSPSSSSGYGGGGY